jgi:hypothetical protein
LISKSKTSRTSSLKLRLLSRVLRLRLRKKLLSRKSLNPKRRHSRLLKRKLMLKNNLTPPELLLRKKKLLLPLKLRIARRSSMLKPHQ